MHNNIHRDSAYINCLADFIRDEYNINAIGITPAKRGYYGETWRLETADARYFVKLDYLPRHQGIFQNSLPVVEYLCDSGIDFISRIVKTRGRKLHSRFNSAVLAIFEWIDGENIETDDTKTPEYQMLCKIYPLTKYGFNIPAIEFSDIMAIRFYEKWDRLKNAPPNRVSGRVCSLLEHHSQKLLHRASHLAHFASLCQNDKSGFYITHGDAGGNFFAGSNGKNYIVDWDEVMYAPPERDAWVMCCRGWARKLFNDTLRENNIPYELRPKRLAFHCYHMFFLYLGEFLEDFTSHGIIENIEEYFSAGYFIEERIQFADKL